MPRLSVGRVQRCPSVVALADECTKLGHGCEFALIWRERLSGGAGRPGVALFGAPLQGEHVVDAREQAPIESDLYALEQGETDEGKNTRREGDGQGAEFEGRVDQDAFNQIACRINGCFLFHPDEKPPEARMNMPVTSLLMEAFRVRDESVREAS